MAAIRLTVRNLLAAASMAVVIGCQSVHVDRENAVAVAMSNSFASASGEPPPVEKAERVKQVLKRHGVHAIVDEHGLAVPPNEETRAREVLLTDRKLQGSGVLVLLIVPAGSGVRSARGFDVTDVGPPDAKAKSRPTSSTNATATSMPTTYIENSSARLFDPPPRGLLGVPLGTCVEIVATVIDGDSTRSKADASRYLLRVDSVDGVPLASPPVMRFRDRGESWWPSESSRRDVDQRRKAMVGESFKLIVYETGSFDGVPDRLPFAEMWQGRRFGFEPSLVVLHAR